MGGMWQWPFGGGSTIRQHGTAAASAASTSGRFGWLTSSFSSSASATAAKFGHSNRSHSNGNNSRFSVLIDSLRNSNNSSVKRSNDTDNNNSRTSRVIKGGSSLPSGNRRAEAVDSGQVAMGSGGGGKASRRRAKNKA